GVVCGSLAGGAAPGPARSVATAPEAGATSVSAPGYSIGTAITGPGGSNTYPPVATVRIHRLRAGPSALRSVQMLCDRLASSTTTPAQTWSSNTVRECSACGWDSRTSSTSNTRCGSSTVCSGVMTCR